MKKWVEYQFLAMSANAFAIAKSSVWTDPKPFVFIKPKLATNVQ